MVLLEWYLRAFQRERGKSKYSVHAISSRGRRCVYNFCYFYFYFVVILPLPQYDCRRLAVGSLAVHAIAQYFVSARDTGIRFLKNRLVCLVLTGSLDLEGVKRTTRVLNPRSNTLVDNFFFYDAPGMFYNPYFHILQKFRRINCDKKHDIWYKIILKKTH